MSAALAGLCRFDRAAVMSTSPATFGSLPGVRYGRSAVRSTGVRLGSTHSAT